MGNKTVPEIALTFCLERVFRQWHRDRAPQWSLKGPLSWEDREEILSLARPVQLLPTGQVVERRTAQREFWRFFLGGGYLLKVSGVLDQCAYEQTV